jgi:hypothetical protein
MRHLLVMFYAFVFSFGHSAVPRHAEAVPPPVVANVYTYAPTRYELAHPEYISSYSETACVSCRPTNLSYRVR